MTSLKNIPELSRRSDGPAEERPGEQLDRTGPDRTGPDRTGPDGWVMETGSDQYFCSFLRSFVMNSLKLFLEELFCFVC